MLDDRPPIFYQLTPSTLTDGSQAHGFRCDSRGALMVSSTNAGVSTIALADNADGVAASATVNGDKVVTRETVFNGTSWDRSRKTNLTARLVSAAASTNATSVKATPGDVGKISGFNAAAAKRYLKLYNKASAPTVGTDTPVFTLTLPAGAPFNFDLGNHYFSTGIAYALTVNGADADTTALTAADVESLNITYA